MAGAGYKLFNTGDVLTAAQVNTYLMEQSVMVFADAAARTTALTGVVAEGMLSYLKDTNAVEVYNGSAWVASDDPNAIQNTIVDAKGDLISASAADVPARLAVGNNGETLVADSSTSTGLRYQAPYSQQPVLNSAMQIWQRGTSTTSTNGNGLFGADRWKVYSGTTGRTISQQVTNDTTNLPFIQYCSRLARDNGNTNTSAITYWQNFETVNTRPFSGQTVTLSFYGRKGANYSEASSNLNVVVRTGTGTDQDAFYSGYTGSTDVLNTNKVLTTTWQRFTNTFSIGATATEMAIGFTANFVGTAGAADYVEITGVQLELGSVATPFHTYGGTLAGELAACQRYYQRIRGDEGNAGTTNPIALGSYYNTTIYRAIVRFPVKMRKIPDFSSANSANYFQIVGNGATTGYAATTLDIASPDAASLNVTVSGATAGTSAWLQTSNASSFVDFSAEL